MKQVALVISYIVIIFAFVAATSPRKNVQPFTRSIGKSIDGVVGEQWIANYMKANNQDEETTYLLQTKDLQRILNKPGCNGISLYYALDSRNQVCLIPVGIDTNGRKMKSDTVAVMNGYTDWTSSKNLINRFSGTLSSHYFGANTFSRLIQFKRCKDIIAILALDNYGREELLLVNADLTNPTAFEGKSLLCPSVCPISEKQ